MSKSFSTRFSKRRSSKLPEEEREPYRARRATAEKDRTPEQKALIKKYPERHSRSIRSIFYDKELAQESHGQARGRRPSCAPQGRPREWSWR